MSSKLFVFRHAESADNEYSLFSGGRNTQLSKDGFKEADELSELLSNEKIDLAYTSDLIRSIDTMSIVLKHHPETRICVDGRIRERSYGWLEGHNKKTWSKYAYPLFKVFHRSYYIPPPGGESFRMVKKRVLDFVMDLEKYLKDKNRNVAICVHSGSIRPIRQYFEKINDKNFTNIETNPAELFTYEIK